MTIAATCIQADSKAQAKEDLPPPKRVSKRIATLVIDDATSGARVFNQPKVIYRKLSKKSYIPPSPTYGPRRTKYGPPRTLKKPGKKYRGKNSSKHPPFPYAYKKRALNPRYGSPKRGTMRPVYGPPKSNRPSYDGIGFGEPPLNYHLNKHHPSRPSKFKRTKKPESSNGIPPKPHHIDFSSPATISDNFPIKEQDNMWRDLTQEQYESASSIGYGEPPVDSYGAPIKSNLHDLTFSTPQSSFLESTSHLDEDQNFGPESRPWNNFKNEPDNHFAYSMKRPIFKKPEKEADIFVTPVPEKENQEINLNSYSDIYNYREEEKAKQDKEKRKTYFQKNIKMINHHWLGPKAKDESKEEIIVGGQYAEPPARYVSNFESTPILSDDNNFYAFINSDVNNDMAVPISSYVNYKNSNMAFSPQNLNDVFSIIDK